MVHKQAAAFGLNSVVYVPKIELDTVTELSAFCEKASMVTLHIIIAFIIYVPL
jgi:hypothetical protein